MPIRNTILLILVSSMLAGAADVKMKVVPVKSTPVSSGHEMYTAYCAPCHGVDGKGNGAAAPALRMRPADLTALSSRNGGKFPALGVIEAIQNGGVTAHGTPEMPVWGPILQSVSSGQMIVKHRIANLASYIESIQEK